MESVNAVIENFIEQADVIFQANALPYFIQMFFANSRPEFRIMQQEISQLRSLLDQIDLGHPGCFTFEFLGGDADDFAQDVARVVKRQSLVKITGE